MQWRIIKAVALLMGGTMLASARQGNGVQIVPIPVKARLAEGAAYQVTPSTMIVCEGDAAEIKAVADRAVEALRRVAGWSLKINPTAGIEGNMVLRLDRGVFSGLPAWQRDEGYRLSASGSRVEVSACMLAQLVIAWTAAQPGGTNVLCAARRVEQARENAAAGSLRLAAADIKQMRRDVEALGEPLREKAELTT